MSGPFLSATSRPRRRCAGAWSWLAAVAVVALLLAGAFGVVALLERGTLARGTTIGGVDVGGLTEAEARDAVVRAAAARAAPSDPARRARRRADDTTAASSGPARCSTTRSRRRSTGAPSGACSRGSASATGRSVALSYRLAPVPAAELANRLDRRFGEPWRDGRS